MTATHPLIPPQDAVGGTASPFQATSGHAGTSVAAFTGNLDSTRARVDHSCHRCGAATTVTPREAMTAHPEFDPEADLVARMRAAGFTVSAATRDTLPPPRYTIPPKQFFFRMRAGLRRLSHAALRIKHRHATVP